MDIHALELATKLLQHKAKTKLVALITHLSESAIKDTYRRLHKEMPRQGLSPSDAKFFFSNDAIRLESNVLASMFVINNLTTTNEYDIIAIDLGYKFIQAYETYLQFSTKQRIDINRAWLMLLKLREGELTFSTCAHCKTQFLEHYDIVKDKNSHCLYCQQLDQRYHEEIRKKRNLSHGMLLS